MPLAGTGHRLNSHVCKTHSSLAAGIVILLYLRFFPRHPSRVGQKHYTARPRGSFCHHQQTLHPSSKPCVYACGGRNKHARFPLGAAGGSETSRSAFSSCRTAWTPSSASRTVYGCAVFTSTTTPALKISKISDDDKCLDLRWLTSSVCATAPTTGVLVLQCSTLSARFVCGHIGLFATKQSEKLKLKLHTMIGAGRARRDACNNVSPGGA